MKSWFSALLCALLVLSPAFWMQTHDGFIRYYDRAAGRWYETGTPEDGLCAADRALLRCGLPLDSRAALARALEDFCS